MAKIKLGRTQTQITYKREKGKMEISGDADRIKVHIWIDQITSILFWAAPVIILLCFLPKFSWLPILIKWFKKILILMPFLITIGYLLMQLSG